MDVSVYHGATRDSRRLTVIFTPEERAEICRAVNCDNPRFTATLERGDGRATLTIQLRQNGGVGMRPYNGGRFITAFTPTSCVGLENDAPLMRNTRVEYIRDARHIVAEIPDSALSEAPSYKRPSSFKSSDKAPAQTPDAKLRAAKNLIESAILEFENSTGGRVNKLLLERDKDGAARVRVGYIPARPVEVEL
jgi:hypothetical protein